MNLIKCRVCGREKVYPNPTSFNEKDFCYHNGYALHVICADNHHEECPESPDFNSWICYCSCHELPPIPDEQWEQIKDGLIEVYRSNVKT